MTDDPTRLFRSAESRLHARYGLDCEETILTLGQPAIPTRLVSSGEGPPGLHVHVGGAFGSLWTPLASSLPGRRHIMPDRPGFVLTPWTDLRGVDLRRHAVAFLSRLLDGLELDTVDVVANS